MAPSATGDGPGPSVSREEWPNRPKQEGDAGGDDPPEGQGPRTRRREGAERPEAARRRRYVDAPHQAERGGIGRSARPVADAGLHRAVADELRVAPVWAS